MDIIKDILTRVQDRLLDQIGLHDAVIDVLTTVDRDVRQEYGGERPYIAKTREETLIQSAKRDTAIRRAWKEGESITIIANRHGLSRTMIYKIVRGL